MTRLELSRQRARAVRAVMLRKIEDDDVTVEELREVVRHYADYATRLEDQLHEIPEKLSLLRQYQNAETLTEKILLLKQLKNYND